MLSLTLSLLAVAASASARSPYDVPKSEWDALNSTVGGRLAFGVPFARSCFPDVGPNVTTGGPDCATVQANYGVNTFRVNQFGSMMRTQWETCQKINQGCLIDSDNPQDSAAFSPPKVCYQGSIAPYYISVKEPSDVTQAFAFSNRTGVPLSIKNTGHDFAGKSSGPGTLALWTRNMQDIKYDASFVPDGCSVPGVPAVTNGAGVDLEAMYEFAEANKITFVGGSAKTVGVAGWLLGGGHSVLSNHYGLGVDRVLQFKVVTPDGQYRTANACQNQDLFWALRGGGGGTFGVVMEITSEVIPNPLSIVSLQWNFDPQLLNVTSLFGVAVDSSLQWVQDGWGGYIVATTSILANPKLNAAEAAANLKPLTDYLQASGAQFEWKQYESFWPLFDAIQAVPIPVGVNGAVSSRLVPKSLFSNILSKGALYTATLSTVVAASGQAALFMTTPFNYAAKADATSVTPVWREAVWHVVTTIPWDWDASAARAKLGYTTASAAVTPLRALTIGGGAYLNEADTYEPSWENSFWGESNYKQLLATKKKYDPDSLLDCWHCVGSKGRSSQTESCYY
ncbi:FAD-binding domain protein [Ceratobasidium sp. AG-Ba]|nr:FAD-binding domain protein [Ceratobasidium sp. AG-Ba]